MSALYWLLFAGILLVLEMITLGLTTIWFAGGAIVAAIASMLQAPIVVQILCFLLVSIVLLLFTRPIAEKYLNKSREKTNVDSLAGQQGRVIEEINPFHQTGRVLLKGMEWSATGADEKEIFSPDTVVEVVCVKGAHLVVSRVDEVTGKKESDK